MLKNTIFAEHNFIIKLIIMDIIFNTHKYAIEL